MFQANSRKNHPQPFSTRLAGHPGQIAVVILLIMAVLLVVGLSVASRTTKEIALTGQEQDSARVFNAAETGVEQALSDPANFNGSPVDPNGVAINTDPSIAGRYYVTAQQNSVSATVPMGSSLTVYVGSTGFNPSINWAKDGGCDDHASLVVAVYYTEGGTAKVRYQAIKPCDYSNGNKAQGFSSAGVGSGAAGYQHQITLNDINPLNVQFIRIRPVYASADIYVTDVPSQAYEIRSEAQNIANGAGSAGEKSAIQVTRQHPAPPLVFDYSVYSGGTLVGSNN